MLGAGVFVVFGPVADLTGSLMPLAIVLAGLVAYLNAGSISQLAAKVPKSGGAYSYARHYLNPTWGFLAGASFLVGKIASSAAIALVVAEYVSAENLIPFALAAVLVMTLINIAGINRTALGSKVLAGITLLFFAVLITAASFAPAASPALEPGSILNIPSAAAIVFFAFAGYARVATMASEVDNSAKSVPKAIAWSLAIVVSVYLAIGILLPQKLGKNLGGSLTPIADLAAVGFPNLNSGVVAIFAALAGLGSLLALLAGMTRTAAAMADDGELTRVFRIRIKNGVPIVAEVVIALFVGILVLSGSVVLTIGLSSFAVLSYYAIANLAAFRQPKAESGRPKWLNLIGLASCLLLALSVPVQGLIVGIAVLALLLFLRWGLVKLR
jgi:APA family basic amino acid/polyamine antiporter|tara:strand:+ start:784 stop:1938 length:1155 start_codon:yes stop_codon:yes gene_type:complete